MRSSNVQRPGWHSVGPVLTLIGVALLALSPLGYRLGWFGLNVALKQLIPLGLLVCALGLLGSLIALFRTPAGIGWFAWIVPFAAVVVSIAVCSIPLVGIVHARSVPPIHDITTDTDLPPVYVALAAARKASPNGLDYEGEGGQVAAQQKAAFPDVKTVYSPQAPEALFDQARKVAQECGWRLAAADRSDLRIEAVDTTMLFGFKDDIVVQIRADANGSRLDIRSASRVGRSDLGVNAARIRKFLALLQQPAPKA